MFMGTLAHVQPRKTLSEKKYPGLGSFFVVAHLPVLNFFLLKSKYKNQILKEPDLGPQIPGFEVQALWNIQEAPRAQRLLAQSASSLQLWCFLVFRKPTRTALLAPLIGQ